MTEEQMQMVEKRTVMREIRRKEGLVEVEGRTIRLLQVEALAGIAQGS